MLNKDLSFIGDKFNRARKFSRKDLRILSYISLALILIFLWLWTDPTPKVSGTVKVYDRNQTLLFESSGIIGHKETVQLSEAPKDLIKAIVLTEDERFYKHFGVDPLSIIRAIYQNIRFGKVVSGASTIPQQLVRFTVISPYKQAKFSIFRKIRESLMATRLTLTNSKDQILEDYINSMHFGRSVYGVQAASRLYFNKDVSGLSLAQSALLAGMIANPTKYDPILHPEEATLRRNNILGEMNKKGIIDNERYERALEELLPSNISEFEFLAPHAVEMAKAEVEKLGLKGKSGISIYTTLDSGWYLLIKEIANRQVEKLKYKHDLTNAAVVVLRNDTGEILSILGSVDYFDDNIQGKNNMAMALRQPGSSIKPVTYAAAFQKGIATAATSLDDSPKVYLTKKGEGFLPHNYDGQYRGMVLAREALASSYNLPAVEMLERVGIEEFLNLVHQMGVTSMSETDRYDLALTLGGGEVNLLELTNLYATFARGGKWIPTQLVTKIVSDNGEIIYKSESSESNTVLDEKVAWLITDILSDKKARIPTFGEKNVLVLSKPAAVKTGTTTDWHDNWTIGYTKDFTVGVWVGNSDNHPMRQISGVTGAAPIWNQIFEELLKFNPYTQFIRPDGIIDEEICAWDGLLASEFCTEKYIEVFIEGTQPNKVSTLAQKLILPQGEVQIINPRQGAIFEKGAAENESIVFEISNDPNLDDVEWILDGKTIDCLTKTRFTCSWYPLLGRHEINVVVKNGNSQKLLTPANFEVLEYKEGQ